MDLGLKGRGALVAGGAGAIGGRVAATLAREGVRVVVTAREIQRLADAEDELGASHAGSLALDLRDPDSIAAAVRDAERLLDGIDILVIAAAGRIFSPMWQWSWEDWRTELDTKLIGTVDLARTAAVAMARRGRGVIVGLSGIAAHRMFSSNPMNGAANAAVENSFRILGAATARHGVRVLSVSPGMTMSDRYESFTMMGLEGIAEAIPIGRIADPQEIAEVVTFLSSDRASYMTATEVIVDGGRSALDARGGLPANDLERALAEGAGPSQEAER